LQLRQAPYRNGILEMAGEPDHAYAAGYQFERGNLHFESTSGARKSKQTKPAALLSVGKKGAKVKTPGKG
jgi:hypothetical protein